jgi:hypothetical protein
MRRNLFNVIFLALAVSAAGTLAAETVDLEPVADAALYGIATAPLIGGACSPSTSPARFRMAPPSPAQSFK